MGLLSDIEDGVKRVGTAVATGGLSELGGIVDSVTGSKGVEEAAQAQAQATLQASREAEALNRERYGEAQGYMQPYMDDARTARDQQMIEMGLAPGEANTAYMNAPGYKAAMSGVEQSMANTGNAYSGARMGASQQVQGGFYNNYMSMLQNMGSPQVATNMSSLGVGQAATMGQQSMQAQQTASGYMMGGAQAKQQGRADALGGLIQVGAGFI